MPRDPSFEPLPTIDQPATSAPPSTIDETKAYASTAVGSSATAAPIANAPSIPGYTVTAEIARGGMGRVFAARDLTLKREVAIKTLLPRASTERFVTESEITARLPHPGIPPVHEMNRLPDGSPYLVMKLIRGRTLAKLLTERSSPTDDLPKFIQIFEQIAQAVGFAHSQGIIHRDVKPLNVMVGAFGEVQVMDWGLAKDLASPGRESGGADDDPSLTHTVAGSIMGTPGYMAPEQARGEPADARADVFALGATLAAILTGKPAFVGTGARESIEMAANAALADVWSRLDECGADAELIAIAKRCLAASPADRFADGQAVAERIAAYRAGVEDRLRRADTEAAASAVREAEQRKRRRVLLSAAAAISLVLAVGLGISLWQMNRAIAAEAQAKGRLTQIEKGNSILAAIFNDLDLRRVRDGVEPLEAVLAKRLIAAAEQLEAEAVGDALSVARLQSRLAVALTNLAHPQEAIALLTKSDSTFNKELGRQDPETLTNRQRLASAQQIGGQLSDALAQYEETYRLRKATLGAEHADTISSMASLAAGYLGAGKLEKALPLFEESLKLQKAAIGADHPETLTNLTNLAAAYQGAGRLPDALPLYEEAYKARRATLGADHADTLASMNNLAMGYRDLGMMDKALPLLEESFNLHRTRMGPNHQFTFASMGNLGLAYRSIGKFDKALPLLEQAYTGKKSLLGADHPETLIAMDALASGYREAGRVPEAVPLLEEAVRRMTAVMGADHPQTLTTASNLGVCYYHAGRIADALKSMEETLRRRKAKLGVDHPETLTGMNSLAAAYYASNQLDKALPLFEETLQVQKRKLGADHPDTLVTLGNVAFAYHAAGRFAQALPLLEESLALRKAKFGPDHPNTLLAMNNLALGYQAANKLAQAVKLFEETVQRQKSATGPDHPATLNTSANLASAYLASGRKAEAIKLQEDVLARQKTALGADHPDTLNSMANLGDFYRKADRLAEAVALLEQVGLALEKRNYQHQHAARIIENLISTLDAAKQPDRAETWRRKWKAATRK